MSTIFKNFDTYIKDFETEDFAADYWYDEGVFIAENMLQQFGNNDWEELIQVLPERTIGWKRRLAYCLDDSENLKQLETLLLLTDTDDNELFEIAVDSLRSFKDSQAVLENSNDIIKKIEALMPEAGIVIRKVFLGFLSDGMK